MLKDIFSSKLKDSLKGTFLPRRTIASDALNRLERHSQADYKIGSLEELLASKEEELKAEEKVRRADAESQQDDEGDGRFDTHYDHFTSAPSSHADSKDGDFKDGETPDDDMQHPLFASSKTVNETYDADALVTEILEDAGLEGQELERKASDPVLEDLMSEESILGMPDADEPLKNAIIEGEEATGAAECVTLKSLRAVAQRVIGAAQPGKGFVVLVSCENPETDITPELIEIGRDVADARIKTLMLDRSSSRNVVSSGLGLARTPGMKELLCGRATVEDVIKRDPQSSAQFIAAGNPRLADTPQDGGVDFEMMLDALADVYGCVIIHADFLVAREIFETCEAQLGAAIMIGSSSVPEGQQGPRFLGLKVNDTAVIGYVKHEEEKPGLFGFKLPV